MHLKSIRYNLGLLSRKFGVSPGILKQIKFFDAFKNQHRIMGEARVIFDVGAYDGRTVKEYRKYYPQSRIYSFEPFPRSFQKLKDYKATTRDNHLEIIQIALTDKDGPVTLFSNKLAVTNSVLPLSKGAVKFNPQMQSREEITVPGKTLDTFCQEQNIIEIDILKMDIQGGELLALRGARKMLSEKRIHVLYLEVEFEEFYKGQPLYHHLVAHLENFGYEMYSMTDISLSDKGKWLAGDAIFVKK